MITAALWGAALGFGLVDLYLLGERILRPERYRRRGRHRGE